MVKEIRLKLGGSWQPIIGYFAGIAAVMSLLIFKLGSIVPGLSPYEASSLANTSDIHHILNNPVNAPFNLMQWLLHYFSWTTPAQVRGVSVFFAFIAAGLFYYVLKNWHTWRIAVLGTALFASSAWFFHIARQSTPDVLLIFAIIAVLAYGTWLKLTKRVSWALFVGALLLSILVYVPGVIWILAAGLVWQRKLLLALFKRANWLSKILSIFICFLALSALGWAIFRQPSVARSIAGLPLNGIFSPRDSLVNLAKIPVRIFYRGPSDPTFWLGTLPLLGIFATVTSIIGAYAYWLGRKLDRTKVLIGLFIMTTVLSALSGLISLALLLPLMYLLVIRGVTLLLQQWLTVFPRNPLARGVGRGLITVVIILATFYNINHYFVAWPNAPETKAAFTIQQ